MRINLDRVHGVAIIKLLMKCTGCRLIN